MSVNGAGPSGLPTATAPRAFPKFPSYVVPNDPQGLSKAHDAERSLLSAGWRWASQLAVECERFGVHVSDFGDRLCGTACGYLRDCGESGRTPALTDAEAVLTAHAVPRDPGELAAILRETIVPSGVEFADLVSDVLRGSEQRSAAELRQLTRDTLKITLHAIGCPTCQACARGKRPDWQPPRRREKAVVYV
jgi:hypothetical protein